MSYTHSHPLTKYVNMSNEKDAYHVVYICWTCGIVMTDSDKVYRPLGVIKK